MKRIVMLLLAVCMIFALCACDGTEDIPEAPEAAPNAQQPQPEPETTEAPEEPSEVPEQTAEAAPAEPTYTVKLTDEEGNPMAGVMVQICLESCMPALTDANGVAAFFVAAEDGYYATVTAMPEGYGYAGEEEKFYFEDGSEVTIVLKAVA